MNYNYDPSSITVQYMKNNKKLSQFKAGSAIDQLEWRHYGSNVFTDFCPKTRLSPSITALPKPRRKKLEHKSYISS